MVHPAILLLVAVIVVAGQYTQLSSYADNLCTTPSLGFVNCTNPVPSCKPQGSIYVKGECLSTDPMNNLPDTVVWQKTYATYNKTCSNNGAYVLASASLPNACIGSLDGTFLKLSGCSSKPGNVTYSAYDDYASCNADAIPPFSLWFTSGQCSKYIYDLYGGCPAALVPAATPVKSSAVSSTTAVGVVSLAIAALALAL